jgi:hypothetical protein
VDGVVEVDVAELPDWLLDALPLLLGAAAAPAMPASAPPPASAPATNVAPSVLFMCIGSNLLDRWVAVPEIVRRVAKRSCTRA